MGGNVNREILLDAAVRLALQFPERGGINLPDGKFDSGGFRADVDALRFPAVQIFGHRGEQVLAGVVLHQIKASVPIDLAMHSLAGNEGLRRLAGTGRLRDPVQHSIFAFSDTLHGHAVEDAQVVCLPACAGIKRRAVQLHSAIGIDGGNGGGECGQIAIFLVKAFRGHTRQQPPSPEVF